MADGNEIEIRATVGLELLAVAREPVFIIEKVEEKPLDMKKLQAMPGILVYMVKPGDELWDIARKYHTSIQEIRTDQCSQGKSGTLSGNSASCCKKSGRSDQIKSGIFCC